MNCVNHPEKDSIGMCVSCGKYICEACEVKSRGESFCKDCISKKACGEKEQGKSSSLAALLSFIMPGLGQIYNGQIGKGLLIFITGWLILPWIYGIYDAYQTAEKINSGEIHVEQRLGCAITAVIFMIIVPILFAIMAIMLAVAIPAFMAAKQEAEKRAYTHSSSSANWQSTNTQSIYSVDNNSDTSN